MVGSVLLQRDPAALRSQRSFALTGDAAPRCQRGRINLWSFSIILHCHHHLGCMALRSDGLKSRDGDSCVHASSQEVYKSLSWGV